MKNNTKKLKFDLLKGRDDLPTIVFVHGSGCTKNFLRPLAEQFGDFNCYLIDLPDHGDSPTLGILNVNGYIDSVSEFIKTIDNDVIVLGHSLGGTITLGVASRNLDNVKGSVVISSGARFPKLDKKFMAKIREGDIDLNTLMACLEGADQETTDKALGALDTAEVMIKDFILDEEVDILDEIHKIQTPVYIMTGGAEILTLVEYSEEIMQELDYGILEIIPNERHLLPLTQKENIAEKVINFINNL